MCYCYTSCLLITYNVLGELDAWKILDVLVVRVDNLGELASVDHFLVDVHGNARIKHFWVLQDVVSDNLCDGGAPATNRTNKPKQSVRQCTLEQNKQVKVPTKQNKQKKWTKNERQPKKRTKLRAARTCSNPPQFARLSLSLCLLRLPPPRLSYDKNTRLTLSIRNS